MNYYQTVVADHAVYMTSITRLMLGFFFNYNLNTYVMYISIGVRVCKVWLCSGICYGARARM